MYSLGKLIIMSPVFVVWSKVEQIPLHALQTEDIAGQGYMRPDAPTMTMKLSGLCGWLLQILHQRYFKSAKPVISFVGAYNSNIGDQFGFKIMHCSGHHACDLEVSAFSPNEVESAVTLRKCFLSGHIQSSINELDWGKSGNKRSSLLDWICADKGRVRYTNNLL